LRALAILLVFCFHARVPGFNGGFIGVDLFFVLSGYLITSVLREEIGRTGGISLVGFYRNRALRLWPALILMLCAYLAFAPLLWPGSDALGDVLLAGLYLTDYSFPWLERPDILNHTWSLAVEAQFYLLWPFVVLLLARLTRRQAMMILMGLFLAATLWRWQAGMAHASWGNLYFRFDMRVSGLVLGSLLAFAAFELDRRAVEILGGVSLLLIGALSLTLYWKSPWAIILQPVIDLASAALVAALASRVPSLLQNIFSARAAVYLGLLSYSIYLWHYPIIRLLRDHDWTVMAVAGAVISLICAQLSFTFLELPLKRYRHSRRRQKEPRAPGESTVAA
jgi:peptidoglycan/LPS O-acetylase OafA/YrhL